MKKAIVFLVLLLAVSLSFGQTRPSYRIVPVSTLNYAVVIDIPANSLYTSIKLKGRIVIFYTDSCTINFRSVKGNWRQSKKVSANALASNCAQNNSTRYGALVFSEIFGFNLGNRTSGGTDTLLMLTASNKVNTGWITLHNGTTIKNKQGTLENCWNSSYAATSPYIAINTSFLKGTWYSNLTNSGKQPLPVSLLNFTAKLVDRNVVLNWSTGWEKNSSGFEVQKSQDGEQWSTLDFIQSKGDGGNSVERIEYQFVDKQAKYSTTVYYRLKQVDLDRSEVYSDVIAINLTVVSSDPLMSVQPNPLRKGEMLKIVWNEKRKGPVLIRIMDSHGRLVFQSISESGVKKEDLDLNNYLSSGIYYLYCSDQRSQEVIQLRFL